MPITARLAPARYSAPSRTNIPASPAMSDRKWMRRRRADAPLTPDSARDWATTPRADPLASRVTAANAPGLTPVERVLAPDVQPHCPVAEQQYHAPGDEAGPVAGTELALGAFARLLHDHCRFLDIHGRSLTCVRAV